MPMPLLAPVTNATGRDSMVITYKVAAARRKASSISCGTAMILERSFEKPQFGGKMRIIAAPASRTT